MSAQFGGSQFGTLKLAGGSNFLMTVAVLGDISDHVYGGNSGTLVTTSTDNTVTVGGIAVCAQGCNHSCPIPGHSTTQVTAITTKSKVNGKLIITHGAQAGCGAVIVPVDRKVYCE